MACAFGELEYHRFSRHAIAVIRNECLDEAPSCATRKLHYTTIDGWDMDILYDRCMLLLPAVVLVPWLV
eukprot:scaffold103815_cov28-Tisochrysis_lutea.AAC.1